jgi:hypothetical protein
MIGMEAPETRVGMNLHVTGASGTVCAYCQTSVPFDDPDLVTVCVAKGPRMGATPDRTYWAHRRCLIESLSDKSLQSFAERPL